MSTLLLLLALAFALTGTNGTWSARRLMRASLASRALKSVDSVVGSLSVEVGMRAIAVRVRNGFGGERQGAAVSVVMVVRSEERISVG